MLVGIFCDLSVDSSASAHLTKLSESVSVKEAA